MCCTRLDENTGSKNRHFRTIALLCRAVFSQVRHVSTIEKNLLNTDTSSTCPHNMVNLGLLTAEVCWRVWGTPANFKGFHVLAALLHGTLVVGVSQTVALNRGRHLYLAGRPSRWALAHILVDFVITSCGRACRDGYNAVSHAHIYGRWCLPSTWTICLVTPTCLRGMCYAQVFLMSFSSWLQLFCI